MIQQIKVIQGDCKVRGRRTMSYIIMSLIHAVLGVVTDQRRNHPLFSMNGQEFFSARNYGPLNSTSSRPGILC